MSRRKIREYQNPELAKSAVVDGKLIIRGTRAWEDREVLRYKEGNQVLSFGRIEYDLHS